MFTWTPNQEYILNLDKSTVFNNALLNLEKISLDQCGVTNRTIVWLVMFTGTNYSGTGKIWVIKIFAV